MSKCTFKQETPNSCVNDTRDKKLVQAIECVQCPYWDATENERIVAEDLRKFRISEQNHIDESNIS